MLPKNIDFSTIIPRTILAATTVSFSVLKAWVRRFYDDLWPLFEGSFGDFLRYAVARSRCDRFAREHFKHSAGGYIFEADIQALQRRIEEGNIQIDFN